MANPAGLPNVSKLNGRYVYRRRIPGPLRALAGEMFNCHSEFTASLGSNPELATRKYPGAMAGVQSKLDRLAAELARRRALHPPPEPGHDDDASQPALGAKPMAPVDLGACRRSVESWYRRDIQERYQAATNGGLPNPGVDYSAWTEWAHERSELGQALRRIDVRRDPDVDKQVPGITNKLVSILKADGHPIDRRHPALRPLLMIFRDAWLSSLDAEGNWASEIALGRFPELPEEFIEGTADEPRLNGSSNATPLQPGQHIAGNVDGDGLTEASPFSALVRYYLQKRTTKLEDVDLISRRFLENLGQDKPIGQIAKRDIVNFRNLLERMPARLSAEDRKLTLPQLAEKFGARVRAAVSLIQANEDDDLDDDNIRPQADASIEKYLNIIKAMFSLAFDEDAIPANPAYRVTATKRGIGLERVPWNAEDIHCLFTCDIYVGADSQNGESSGKKTITGDADYWLPLIAVLSGMRCEEIGQLLPTDILEVEGIHVFEISKTDTIGKKLKRLKTDNASRIVPIHPILTDLGFLDYVKAVKAAQHERLFPDLKVTTEKNKAKKFTKDFSSKRFLRLRKRLGLIDPRKPFHSLRHTIKAVWKDADVSAAIQNELLGHAPEGGAPGKYARKARTALSKRANVIRATAIPGMPTIQRPTTFGIAAIPREQWPVPRQPARRTQAG
jgi:integrase